MTYASDIRFQGLAQVTGRLVAVLLCSETRPPGIDWMDSRELLLTAFNLIQCAASVLSLADHRHSSTATNRNVYYTFVSFCISLYTCYFVFRLHRAVVCKQLSNLCPVYITSPARHTSCHAVWIESARHVRSASECVQRSHCAARHTPTQSRHRTHLSGGRTDSVHTSTPDATKQSCLWRCESAIALTTPCYFCRWYLTVVWQRDVIHRTGNT